MQAFFALNQVGDKVERKKAFEKWWKKQTAEQRKVCPSFFILVNYYTDYLLSSSCIMTMQRPLWREGLGQPLSRYASFHQQLLLSHQTLDRHVIPRPFNWPRLHHLHTTTRRPTSTPWLFPTAIPQTPPLVLQTPRPPLTTTRLRRSRRPSTSGKRPPPTLPPNDFSIVLHGLSTWPPFVTHIFLVLATRVSHLHVWTLHRITLMLYHHPCCLSRFDVPPPPLFVPLSFTTAFLSLCLLLCFLRCAGMSLSSLLSDLWHLLILSFNPSFSLSPDFTQYWYVASPFKLL